MATFFSWKSSYSVGIPSIDEQHKKLVDLLNSLWDAMSHGHGNEVCGKILNELVNYTMTHFETEERIFAKYAYPDAAAHKFEHEKLRERVKILRADLQSGKAQLSIQLADFLKEWLTHHIRETDMKYSQFLQSKGVK